MRTIDERTVAGAIEDEMQRFEIVVRHDGKRIVGVESTAVRYPWLTCAESPSALSAFAGQPLTADPLIAAAWTDHVSQCTHQFDLMALVNTHATRSTRGGAETRIYDSVVPDWKRPPYVAHLHRDGELLLDWTIGPDGIIAPDEMAGRPLNGGFLRWCAERFDAEIVEAAALLRTAAWMSVSRTMDINAYQSATEAGTIPGSCFAAQPVRMALSRRSTHATLDFGRSPQRLLSGWSAGLVGPEAG